MDEKNNVTKSHKVLLANRKNGAFSGVVDVLSFDVAEILLETELGMLLIKGHDLHVNRLSLEKGEIDIEGRIDSLTYSEPKNVAKQTESLLGRLLAGAGDRKQGERGDFHRGSFSRNLGSGGDGTIPAVRYFSYFPKNRATWRNLDWSGRLLLLVTMHCCGFSDAVSGE